MSQYDFENHHDGEWDENEGIAWNEGDWNEFLRKSDNEISRFICAYNKSIHKDDRLDATAKLMGWHRDDWSSSDEIDIDDEIDLSRNDKAIESEDDDRIDPYTLHRHPVYISASALFSFLRASWEHLMKHNRKKPEHDLSWSYCASLADAERHCILAATSLDLGDFLLAVCHLKRAHSALNESMRLNRLFIHHDSQTLENYLSECDIRMHDLREIWLRIMHDCRK